MADSYEYIREYASSEVNSVIRKDAAWQTNMREGMEFFKHLHGAYPIHIPDTHPQEVMKTLENIEKNYARKVL